VLIVASTFEKPAAPKTKDNVKGQDTSSKSPFSVPHPVDIFVQYLEMRLQNECPTNPTPNDSSLNFWPNSLLFPEAPPTV
jgi:hypothetical protein